MNFQESKEYVKRNSEIDVTKFNSVIEFTGMLDLLNKEIEDKRAEDHAKDIHSVSNYLLRSLTTKTFIIGNNK